MSHIGSGPLTADSGAIFGKKSLNYTDNNQRGQIYILHTERNKINYEYNKLMSTLFVYSVGFFPLKPLRLTIVVFNKQKDSRCRIYLIESE